jgi:hypothetical protein
VQGLADSIMHNADQTLRRRREEGEGEEEEEEEEAAS